MEITVTVLQLKYQF